MYLLKLKIEQEIDGFKENSERRNFWFCNHSWINSVG